MVGIFFEAAPAPLQGSVATIDGLGLPTQTKGAHLTMVGVSGSGIGLTVEY